VNVGAVEDGQVSLVVHDVSGTDGMMVRSRLDAGAWSEWSRFDALRALAVGEASDIEVEVKDSEGNIGSKQQALIRGKPNAAAGCNCSVSGDPRAPSGALWLVVAGIAAVVSRLVSRRSDKPAAPARQPSATAPRSRFASRAALAVAVIGLGGWSGCSCGDDEEDDGAAAGGDYKCEGDCRTLEAGLIGAYTSAAVSGSTVWVAGYLEADWNHDNQYGDLVVGTWDGSKVAWQIVDGVPAEPEVDGAYYDKNGFRGGQTEPGPDVGLWTSIAVDGSGNPAVAYYDRTNRQLKLATRAGDAWEVSVVEGVAGSDIGRYAQLTFVGDTPVIAYLLIEPGTGGATTSKIRLARGDAGAWSYEDVLVDTATPCRKAYCPTGTACVADTGLCVEPLSDSGCDPACSGATACIDQGSGPACADVFDDSRIDAYPDAVGLYLSLAQGTGGSLAIAYYDRIRGNLGLATNEGGTWTTRILDGQNGETDTGDVGIGASLFVDDQGTMHLSYVDGYAESLKYLKVSGSSAGAAETVDDGLHLAGMKFEDGQHLVGDDSHVVATAGGDVHITYQDATTGQLRYAVGTSSGDTHTWTVSAVEQSGFAGAFSGLVQVNGQLELMNWWRTGADTIVGDVAIVPPP
jgi:MYXO-CTERM domain-containing protein